MEPVAGGLGRELKDEATEGRDKRKGERLKKEEDRPDSKEDEMLHSCALFVAYSLLPCFYFFHHPPPLLGSLPSSNRHQNPQQ